MKIPSIVCAAVLFASTASHASTLSVPVKAFDDSLANPSSSAGTTGIFFSLGDDFSIVASGQIDLDAAGPNTPNGPTGTNQFGNACPPFACGSLIGRIGATGTTFFVGDNFSRMGTTEAGELFLFVNDIDFANNSGEFTARVTVPGGPPPSVVVPLPAGGILLASALGLLGLRRRWGR